MYKVSLHAIQTFKTGTRSIHGIFQARTISENRPV